MGYDADGNRVRKELQGGTETHYVRGAAGETIAVYENGSRKFVNLLSPSGEALGSWDGSQRRYFLKDHLGSVRTTVDQNGNVDGYDDYYPFGLTMPGRSSNSANPNDDYKFTGHEQDDEAGLNLIHMGARGYDPVIVRMLQVDPAHALASSWTPYRYAFNNPMKYIDPDGNFELDAALAKKYPRLAQYLKSGIQSIVSNTKIMNSLMKNGEFTRDEIVEGLTFGKGPRITTTSRTDVYGLFSSNSPNEITLSESLLNSLEAATGTDRDAILFLVAVTILHEFTHYGDFQDGIQQLNDNGTLFEEGNQFELDAYGKIIVGSNASSTIQDFLKRQKQKKSNNEKKARAATELLGNFENLESGTYTWNGSEWERKDD